MKRFHALHITVWIATFAAFIALTAFVPAAGATTGYGFTPPAFGSFTNIQGIAVAQSTGSVYVLDTGGNGSIYKFNSAGAPAEFAALHASVIEGVGGAGGDENELAVDNSNGPARGDIYVANGSHVGIYGADGSSLGELTSAVESEVPGAPWGLPCGVAVDPSGNVYVGLYPSHVSKYTPTAGAATNTSYVSSLSGELGACNVAADAGGVYVATWPEGPVTRYPASQFGVPSPSGAVIDNSGSTLVVNPANNDVFIDERGEVAQYNSSGTLLRRFATQGESLGVAVNSTTEKLYLADTASGGIDIYGLGQTPEAPSTEPATEITNTKATLNGTLNPGSSAKVGYYFEYNTGGTCSGGSKVEASGEVEGKGIAVSTTLTGLEGNTQYTACLVATNLFGATPGSPMSFITALQRPIINSEQGSASSPTEATLSAEIAPGNLDSHYHFEYGTEAASYGQGAPIPDADIGSAPETVEQAIHGLQPGTTYHYRVVATNSVGTEEGPDQTFETPPLAPTVILGQATDIGTTTATLNGTVDPNGADTTYHFNYASPGCIGPGVPEYVAFYLLETCGGKVQGDAGTSPEAVHALLTGLEPATTYTYFLKATSAGGPASAGVAFETAKRFTLTTLPLPPTLTAQPATDIGMTSATGVGLVDPQGGDTRYHFEYGPTTSYGAVSPAPDADAGSGRIGIVISGPFTNLAPGSEYHYRVVAVNAGGTTYGTDQTFITYSPYAVSPSAITAGTGALASTSVTLYGVVDPQGIDTVYRFEYGPSTAYGATAPTPNASADPQAGEQEVSEGLAGLQPGTTYYYRLVGDSAGGTAYGDDETFTTLGTAPAGQPAPSAVLADLSGLAPVAPAPPAGALHHASKTTRKCRGGFVRAKRHGKSVCERRRKKAKH